MRGAMTGGLGVMGFGLTWMGMEALFGRISIPLAVVMLAAAVFSLGMAFSESRLRMRAPWGLSVLLAIVGLAAFAEAPGWYAALILLFAVAYGYLGLFVHWQSHPPHLPHPHLPHFKRVKA
jgi:hypothetical protein